MGAALLITFTTLYTGIPLGRPAQLIGHVTFSLSFVVVTVRARLVSLGTSFEEAARDLGSTRRQAIRLVLLPLLTPAIVAGCVIVFASSIDDFVISSFLQAGASSQTVPVKIDSAVRSSSSPALNALATMMVIISFAALTIAIALLTRWQRRQGRSGGFRTTVADVTQMDL
jgi:spermidine/putrescine transport system permease protein